MRGIYSSQGAAYGSFANSALFTGASTVIMAAAGSELGPEGTFAGGALGFIIGVSVGVSPPVIFGGMLDGGAAGLAEGLLACSIH
jgi:hypothetical protein